MKKFLLIIVINFVLCMTTLNAQILYNLTQGEFDAFGTICKFNAATNELTVVKSFGSSLYEGVLPSKALVKANNGKLYGMTNEGGTGSCGVIFSFEPSSSKYTQLKDFYRVDGCNAYGSLIQAKNGKLYGISAWGGTSDAGVIFSFDPSTSAYTKLKDFDAINGWYPYGSLVQSSDGKLYGMTELGGSTGKGVIFSFDPSNNTYAKLKDFDGNNGGNPYGSLVQAGDGKLYGMTHSGGSFQNGVIFSFDPLTSTYVKLYDFNLADGAGPEGDLMQANDGKLYGMATQGGSFHYGVIFSFDLSNSTYAKLKDFDRFKDGFYPKGSLMQASDGKLYGVAGNVIFSLDPSTSKFIILLNYNDVPGTDGGWSHGFIEVAECIATDSTWYKDADGDGYGNPTHSLKACAQPTGYVSNNTDCNDSNKAVHAPVAYYRDYDGDGFGDPYHPALFCIDVPPEGYVGNNYDCYDGEGASTPGYVRIRMCHDGWSQCVYVKDTAEKIRLGWSLGICPLQSCAADETLMCHNGKQECVKTTDVAAKLAEVGGNWSLGPYCSGVPISACNEADTTYYLDFDRDGFGDPNHSITASTCTLPPGYVFNNSDCDDNNKAIHALVTYYRDYDRDGFGDPYHPISACSNVPAAGYVKNNYDCYDLEGASDPGQVRVRMCHDGWTQCVYVKDTAEKLSLGWSLGICPLQSCAADETLMCHNGKQECVKTTNVASKLNEAGGKWSLGPFCSGVPISGSGSNSVRKIDMARTEKSTPTQYSLSNHPNPFAGTSIIKYALPFDSRVSIKVYDLAGRAVATLVDEYKKAGTYTVNFNAKNLNSGSLFYKIIASSKEGQFERTNQMVKIK